MLKASYVKICLGVIFIFSVFVNIGLANADIVWSDDFNDGDNEEWTTVWGNWTTENKLLQVLDYPIDPHHEGEIYHQSTTSTGTWSFDVYLQPSKPINYIFISTNFTFHEYGQLYYARARG